MVDSSIPGRPHRAAALSVACGCWGPAVSIVVSYRGGRVYPSPSATNGRRELQSAVLFRRTCAQHNIDDYRMIYDY